MRNNPYTLTAYNTNGMIDFKGEYRTFEQAHKAKQALLKQGYWREIRITNPQGLGGDDESSQ